MGGIAITSDPATGAGVGAWRSGRFGGARNTSLLVGKPRKQGAISASFLSKLPASPKIRWDTCTPPSPSCIKRLRDRAYPNSGASKTTRPSGATPQAFSAGRLSTVVVHLICNQGVVGSNPTAGTSTSHFILTVMPTKQLLRALVPLKGGRRDDSQVTLVSLHKCIAECIRLLS